jgi:hypothetical protein
MKVGEVSGVGAEPGSGETSQDTNTIDEMRSRENEDATRL